MTVPAAPAFANEEAIAGALGSVGATIFSNPIDVAKTRMQLAGELGHQTQGAYANVYDALKRLLKDGLAEAQKGLAPAIVFNICTSFSITLNESLNGIIFVFLSLAVLNGIRFGLYHGIENQVHRLVHKESTDPGSSAKHKSQIVNTTIKAMSATIAGGIAGAVASPFSLVKTRMQATSAIFKARKSYEYGSTVDAFRKIYIDQGMKGFFRGMDAASKFKPFLFTVSVHFFPFHHELRAVLRLTASSICQLVIYDSAKEAIQHYHHLSNGSMLHLLSSTASTIGVVAVMNPLDVAATRMYQDSEGLYRNPIDCLIKTTKYEGILALYKGSIVQFTRVAPHTILTFFFYEKIKARLV